MIDIIQTTAIILFIALILMALNERKLANDAQKDSEYVHGLESRIRELERKAL